MPFVSFQESAPARDRTGALAGVRVYLDTMGCAKNLVDSEATLGLLASWGCEPCMVPEESDVLVVNTCGFLESAREESIERILELALLKGTARPRLLAVMGCLVARAADELQEAMPEVDVWLPAGHHGDLPSTLAAHFRAAPTLESRAVTDRSGSRRAPITAFAGFGQRILLTPKHTAYLKISEGCTNACSFCSIPLMRGTQRSRPVDEIVAEAGTLAAAGVRELHLVAQDLTHYGFDLPVRADLLDLVRALGDVDGIEWIRLLYAHPAHLSQRLLEGLFTVPKVARYLDMPVQHAVPRLLQAMRRPYSPARVREQCAWLRDHVSGITLRTTVIVGFPGETERDFDALCRFVSDVRFDRLGIFTYSNEPGTAAFTLPGRPRASTAQHRLHALSELQMHIAGERSAARVGSRVRLLVDAPVSAEDEAASSLAAGTAVQGRSEAEALDIDGTIWVEAGDLDPGALRPGEFLDVEILAADVHDLRARAFQAAGAPELAG